ncbi:hypothetical protein Cadr_000002937 [Camelus dromedarius]|uniref:Uncharacterized protein n=1 Tax=Camelus dromedarius TaxID=9838 RepID=A0A5N4C307_CAMDR|nr:hypothetical protein Cadr_000002937 [Camelus dromedarius]
MTGQEQVTERATFCKTGKGRDRDADLHGSLSYQVHDNPRCLENKMPEGQEGY